AAATSRVTASGISARADVVARAAHGLVQLDVTLSAPGQRGDGELCDHQRHDRGEYELLVHTAGQSNSDGSILVRPAQGDPGLAQDTFDAINNQMASVP